MRFRRGTSLASLVVAGLLACNAILGNEESIEYVDGDAGTPKARDGADDDASAADGGGTEAGEIPDAEPDTNVSCDSAIFCSDFDPPFDVQPWGWNSAVPSGGSAFGIDNTNFVTPPNSLRIAKVPSDQVHYLNYFVDGGGRPFTVMFDIRVRAANAGFVDLLQVSCRPSTAMHVGIDATGHAFLAEGAFLKATGPTVPLEKWLRLVFTIHPSSTTLYVYGASPTPMTLTRSCLPPFSLTFGVISDTAPWTVLFDRVRVTAP